MFTGRWIIMAGFLLHAAAAGASMEAPGTVLRVYGPGGPHHVLQDCSRIFLEKHGITVEVVKASPQELARRVCQDGDLYFGGAEYMLDDFARQNPGALDMTSVEMLQPRRVGVVVRKGNPLGIKGTECLQRDEVDLLSVKLENMGQFHPKICDRGDNDHQLVYTGQDGVDAWRASPELDAWVTYKSWHVSLEEESDFIEIPCDHAIRHTPVALTQRTQNREAALHFIDFLKSPEAQAIFEEHGWE